MERRRREAVGRADLSADLTGAVLVQLVIDGDVGRIGRKSANQARVTGLSPEEGIQCTSTDKREFLLLGDTLRTEPRRRQELVLVEPSPDGIFVVQREEDGVRTPLGEC